MKCISLRAWLARHPQYECIHGFTIIDALCRNSDFIEEVANMCRSFVDAFLATEDHIGTFDVIHGHDWLTSLALEWINKARAIRPFILFTRQSMAGVGIISTTATPAHPSSGVVGSYCSDRVITVRGFETRSHVDVQYS